MRSVRYSQYCTEPKNRFQGITSASLCSLAGRCDNLIPTQFLALIDCLKFPAQDFLKICLCCRSCRSWHYDYSLKLLECYSFENLSRQSETCSPKSIQLLVNAAKVPAQNLHNFCGREQLVNAYDPWHRSISFVHRSRIRERTISLRFLSIILSVLRLEVPHITLQTIFQPILLKGGWVKSVSRGDCE